MAHQLKYYKEIESHGHLWRVEILQETEDTLTPMEIGPVLQGLRLVVQGDQADVDTPIVKTSLEMVFVDAPDLEEERKCGYWEEFYTSSATEYQVRLYKDGVREWTGYVTPDSFSEDLRYRGSVSIIARDNLGTLADVPCVISAEAQSVFQRAYIYHLFTEAFAASKCAMQLVYDNLDDSAPLAVNTSALYVIFNRLTHQTVHCEHTSEMSFWEALESVLYATGLVMRYVGGNRIVIMPLRDLPKYGKDYWWDVPVKDVIFSAHGHRELMYGIKEISETQEFSDIEKAESSFVVSEYDETPATLHTLPSVVYYHEGEILTDQVVETFGYDNRTMGDTVASDKSLLLDVSRYQLVEGESSPKYGSWDASNIFYMAVNAMEGESGDAMNTSRELVFSFPITTSAESITFSMVLDKPVCLTDDGLGVMNLPIAGGNEYATESFLHYETRFERMDGSIVSSSSGSWAFPTVRLFVADNAFPVKFSLEGLTFSEMGVFSIRIKTITCTPLRITVRKPCKGCFVRVKDVNFVSELQSDEGLKIISKNTFTTKYSDKYAVKLDRSPKFAINLSQTNAVTRMKEALLYRSEDGYLGADQWLWKNGLSETVINQKVGVPLTQLIHQQLLAYYSKPNNILTGELLDKDRGMPDFSSLWRWNGKNHLLISGSLNILTGRMENAVLREFTRYDHMWETWVENEDVTLDYAANQIQFLVHHQPFLELSVTNLPSWITLESIMADMSNLSVVILSIMGNGTGMDRDAIFHIDTAVVRIAQRAAGDYNIDYGDDYS